MERIQRKLVQIMGLGLLSVGLGACTPSQFAGSQNLKAGESVSPFNVNKYAANKLVCDPFSEDQTPSDDLSQGLHAKLYYLNAAQPRYQDVGDYIQNGVSSGQDLFFTDLNVPTRLFSLGFPTESGSIVKDDAGNNLFEYFALRFEGGLRLAPDESDGDYQLALLSDDGAIWSVAPSDSDTYQVVVNDDGDHPTQLGCGQTIHMTSDTQLKMRLDYYQGPRYHISIIPMWRKVTSDAVAETRCGQNGNDLYFDYNHDSAPQPAYKELLSRGWHPLVAANYVVPQDAGYNPCVQGTPPVVSDVKVQMLFDGVVNISWTTDIPATDQVQYTNVATGEQTLTVSDNILRTSHSIRLNLLPNIEYDFQPISISADYGKTIGDPVRATVR